MRPEPRDTDLIASLADRDGQPTRVLLRDGTILMVLNIAWGYDMGDEFAHVTTNISPAIDGASIDFFNTRHVASLSDPGDGGVIFTAP